MAREASLAAIALLAIQGLAGAANAQSHQTVHAVTLPQIRAIEAAKPAMGSPEAKLGGDLRVVAEGAGKDPAKSVKLDADTRPGASMETLVASLQGTIDPGNSDSKTGRLRITLPARSLLTLAASEEVLRLRPAQRGHSNAIAGFAGDGLTALGFDDAKFKARKLTGQGIKVGIISDSLNYRRELNDAIHQGGVVTVHSATDSSDENAHDEGLAMAEVIHAAAKDAELFFAPGMESTVQFRNAIDYLVSMHCDIIVDDVVFSDENPFENDELAKAVNAAVKDSHVIFISAAGNHGNRRLKTSGTWENNFQDGGAAGQLYSGIASGNVVLFQPKVTLNTIDTVTPGYSPTVDLFWANPIGKAQASYDLYVIAGDSHPGVAKGKVASYELSSGVVDPHLQITDVHVGDSIVILRVSGADAPMLHLSVSDANLRYRTKGNIRGHRASSGNGAFAVAAVPASAVAFGKTPPNDISAFDSDGPRRLRFNDDGTPVVGTPPGIGDEIKKPDFAMVEGARTSLKGPLRNFSGTSSAAAYAAGLFAVALSCPTRPTVDQLHKAIAATAIHVKSADTDEGGAGVLYAPTFIPAACDLPAAAASTNSTP